MISAALVELQEQLDILLTTEYPDAMVRTKRAIELHGKLDRAKQARRDDIARGAPWSDEDNEALTDIIERVLTDIFGLEVTRESLVA